jgi:SsrA-binding protein
MAEKHENDLVSNRKAFYNYEILDTYEAGIVLLGTEIKSLRNGGGSLADAYVDVRRGEPWLLQSSIAPYSTGGVFNHEEKRERKLLLHQREIEALRKATTEKGFVVIPLAIYLSKKGIAKVKIAIAKGKKAYDKRASLKKKEDERSIRDHDH